MIKTLATLCNGHEVWSKNKTLTKSSPSLFILKLNKDLSTAVIYKISCKDFDKVYIGQTSKTFIRSRTRDHKRAIFTGDRNSLLAQHGIKHIHDFDLDNVKIINRCSQWSKILFLKTWHSIRESNAINEHTYIPDIYKALGNPKWRFCGSF